jgi:hypothetical protein
VVITIGGAGPARPELATSPPRIAPRAILIAANERASGAFREQATHRRRSRATLRSSLLCRRAQPRGNRGCSRDPRSLHLGKGPADRGFAARAGMRYADLADGWLAPDASA